MTGDRRPVFDPLLANAVGPVDEFATRFLSVFDNHDHPGIELSLGVIDIRQARPLIRDDVLNGHLGSVGFEYRMAVGVFAGGYEVPEDKKIRNFRGGNQAHQVQVEM